MPKTAPAPIFSRAEIPFEIKYTGRSMSEMIPQ